MAASRAARRRGASPPARRAPSSRSSSWTWSRAGWWPCIRPVSASDHRRCSSPAGGAWPRSRRASRGTPDAGDDPRHHLDEPHRAPTGAVGDHLQDVQRGACGLRVLPDEGAESVGQLAAVPRGPVLHGGARAGRVVGGRGLGYLRAGVAMFRHRGSKAPRGARARDPRAGARAYVLDAHGGALMPRRDLSLKEQANAMASLRMLRVRLGGQNWLNVERALPISHSALYEILSGRAEVSTTVAFRIAKALDVSLQEVLTGEAVPPGTCKHCGMPSGV